MQLMDNATTVIEPGGFSGLGSLTVLYLSVDRLPRIPTAAPRCTSAGRARHV